MFFPLGGTTNRLLLGSQRHPQQLFETLVS
jgi:hypothetical protein